mmetsp:Transcript_12032/g.25862  ORF Transcript_12032/g.25862 Transcript_12032/m.25862 type:complete len:132 (+) Transcript_12032:2-397(+)
MCSLTVSRGQLAVKKLAGRPRASLVPFLAPEIFSGERPAKSCDAYSFGLLMWELYTGSTAFASFAQTPTKLVQTVIGDGLRPEFPPEAPGWYVSLACRCWSANPKLRPPFKRIIAALTEGGGDPKGVAAST